ncbi:protein disulfide-isomerase LQY1, chloroplastic-like isoform X2 [Glycine soja]|uniref:uncharacterized protein isoform X1 n=1 Tax=Glycine max TaxID=3847 RepID=UPI0007191F18|nr:uncharacterized protein LOC100804286 isoform X1 [Glycine max]XP_028210074.1 protein disulfide-isomerase LQY1, chloroplastic-like isoform X2 [Glycine soja]|eukprot:XP_014624804.1 uncharacterized protein LOC100804286 isoform X1 [Glycine max]
MQGHAIGFLASGSRLLWWTLPLILLSAWNWPGQSLSDHIIVMSLVVLFSTKNMSVLYRLHQQPMPIACTSCNSKGHTECKWCGGTGFFIIGDNVLCEVPSRNTSCVVCRGKGSRCCSDCQGTGFRAKWLKEPPTSK